MAKELFIKSRTVLSSTPSTPPTGFAKLYRKSDGVWYELNDAGIETPIGYIIDGDINTTIAPTGIDLSGGDMIFRSVTLVSNSLINLSNNPGSGVVAIIKIDGVGIASFPPQYEVISGALIAGVTNYVKITTTSSLSGIIEVYQFPQIPVSNRVARFPIKAQTISNSVNVWSKIDLDSPTLDSISITQAGGDLTLSAGTYEINIVINFFDNNSPRQSHKLRLKDGTNVWQNSIQSGMNYMRDASNHDESSIVFSDLGQWSGSNPFSFELSSQSSNSNTSNITGGWITIKKLS